MINKCVGVGGDNCNVYVCTCVFYVCLIEYVLKELMECRKEHQESTSSKAMMVWWSNGKKDKEGYNWKLYSKGKMITKDTIGKYIRREEDKEGYNWKIIFEGKKRKQGGRVSNGKRKEQKM